MTNWQVLQFSGNGSFDHEADTREAALVLVLPRPDEGIACSIVQEGALFRKAYFAEAVISISSRPSSLATSAKRRWGRSSESAMVRTFQYATLRFAVFFFLSFFSPIGRDARWPRLANQVVFLLGFQLLHEKWARKKSLAVSVARTAILYWPTPGFKGTASM